MAIDACIITVRNSSTRLPNKAIIKIFNEFSAIDILIKRAQKIELPVIIATSNDPSDDIFEDIAQNHNVKIFRGSLLNKIKRWHDCFTHFDIQNALLIDGDDLSYNYEIGKRAISLIKKLKVDMVLNPSNIICGFFTYALNRNGIIKLYDVASKNLEIAKSLGFKENPKPYERTYRTFSNVDDIHENGINANPGHEGWSLSDSHFSLIVDTWNNGSEGTDESLRLIVNGEQIYINDLLDYEPDPNPGSSSSVFRMENCAWNS